MFYVRTSLGGAKTVVAVSPLWLPEVNCPAGGGRIVTVYHPGFRGE